MALLFILFLCIAQSAYAMDNGESESSISSSSSSGIEIYKMSPEAERITTLAIIANQMAKATTAIESISDASKQIKKIRAKKLLIAKQKKANQLIASLNIQEADTFIENYLNQEDAIAQAVEVFNLDALILSMSNILTSK